ncbi:MAG: NAD(P)H-hydrate dehydratase [Candidatus Promineifilaceae bacterium]
MTTKIFTVAEMVAAERAADASGVSYEKMMETAGMRVAEAISERSTVDGRFVLVLVGPGNNGGDGLVAGRYLAEAGAEVSFYLYKARDPQTDINFRFIKEIELPVVEADRDQDYSELRRLLDRCDILVDALLGTGVARPIGGNLAGLMQVAKPAIANRRKKATQAQSLNSIAELPQPNYDFDVVLEPFITAVDCPSGLNCDSGALDELAIAADLTVTFAGPKRGHFRFPGAGACGELVVADINIEDTLPEVAAVQLELATPELARSLLPERPLQGHKGTFGTVLAAAGSEHYWGAPILSGSGAYRAGAGLVALAVPEVIRATVAGRLPEATYPPVPAARVLDAESAEFLLSGSFTFQAMLVGPGMGPADSFMDFLLANGRELPPLLVDADGLNILSRQEAWYDRLPRNCILTPHPGEMARLLQRAPTELKTIDRVKVAAQAAEEWGQVVLLKGAYTIVAAPDGRRTLLPFANPLMAVGGSGDVLSGIITAYLAQGAAPYEAAVLGGYMHGAAAQLASGEYGQAGLLSGELADWVPQARVLLDGVASYR